MKRVGDLMRELGFREEASEETARAFIENLVRAASGEKWTSSKQRPKNRELEPLFTEEQLNEQLSFDFESVEMKRSS